MLAGRAKVKLVTRTSVVEKQTEAYLQNCITPF
jgi:hypothetical protein